MILNTLILGLIFAVLGFGIFLSFKILNFTDLTAEASFTLGAACSVMFCGFKLPVLGLLVAFIAGACAGVITALLHTKLHIDKVLSGILTLTAFYTVNLAITKFAPNVNLPKMALTLFPKNNDVAALFITLGITLFIGVAIWLFFKTKLGLSIRACGDNETMIQTQSVSTDMLKIVGLALSNALIAFSGALFMQYQRFYDSTFGTGMMVVGVATIIIGETILFFRHNLGAMLVAITAGSLIYRFIYMLILVNLGEPRIMKLVSSLALVIVIAATEITKKVRDKNAYKKTKPIIPVAVSTDDNPLEVEDAEDK